MEEQINNNHKADLWSLTVKDLFYKYVRFLPLFLLSVAVALLIAFAYLRYTTRIYSASGTLMIKNDKPPARSDKVEEIITGGNRQQNIQNEIEILKSRPMMARVVGKLNMSFGYTAKGKIRGLNVYKQAPFAIEAYEIVDSTKPFTIEVKFINESMFRINGESREFTFGNVFKNQFGVFRLLKTGTPVKDAEYSVLWQSPDAKARSLAGSVKIQPKTPGTAILAITCQATNPQMAADIVNGLMVQYDSLTVEQNNYSTDQILGFIDARLHILTSELDTLELEFLRYKQSNNLIDIEKQLGNYFDKLSEADKGLAEQQYRVELVNEIEKYLLDKKHQYESVTPSALTLEDFTLTELVKTYNEFQLRRQNLLDANVPVQNPAIKEIEGQIEKLRLSLLENIKNMRQAYVASIQTLSKRGSGQELQLKNLPYKLKKYVEMERQIQTKRALYTLLEGKREEAAITRASTISNSKVIDGAVPIETPVKPDKRAIQVLAVLIGIGLPALLIFMGELLNDKVSTRFDIERITQAPIMGEIGHSYSDKVLIVNKSSRSMVAEQFRIIRSNLQYLLNKNEKPVILVTSSYSGEGKSFISTNMGAVLALTGKKTVILEFDIRKPKVLSGLGMSKRPGISNYLVGKGELKDLITPVPDQENLWVLACGPIPPNPSELLLEQKVTDMFDWLRQEFDVVVIDTAPVGMVSDAMTLSKFADCTLYLVRQGHTFKKQVALIDELYRANKLPKVSIVINDVKAKPGYGYYGYGRYGYGYGYGVKKGGGNYYEEETPPHTAFERFLNKLNPTSLFKRKG